MPVLTIDGRSIATAPGATVLEAAAELGIRVPTLCHLEGTEPLTTCMVCLVEERGRLVPACSTRAQEGMRVETTSELARLGRRTALELLLSEHAGECEAPCARACPLAIDVPEMLDRFQCAGPAAAWQLLREGVALPLTAARLCKGGCEKACRRRQLDEPVRVTRIHAELADWGLRVGAQRAQQEPRANRGRVTIVGLGPAGLAAADVLIGRGHRCLLVDEHEAPARALRQAIAGDREAVRALDAEVEAIVARSAQLRLGVRVGVDAVWSDLRRECDLLLLATGVTPEGVTTLGVEVLGDTIVVPRPPFQTSAPGVLAAGGAVQASRDALRSLAAGRALGAAADRLLAGEPAPRAGRRACAQLGAVTPAELEALRANRSQRHGDRVGPGRPAEDDRETGSVEAGRCLGCGCRSAGTCALRLLCDEHGAEPRRFSGVRRAVEVAHEHALVRHEPGKCVLCGRCVRLAEAAGEPLGLTFVGRGFGARLRTPLGKPFSQTIGRCAVACAEACPTGALTLRAKGEGGRA